MLLLVHYLSAVNLRQVNTDDGEAIRDDGSVFSKATGDEVEGEVVGGEAEHTEEDNETEDDDENQTGDEGVSNKETSDDETDDEIDVDEEDDEENEVNEEEEADGEDNADEDDDSNDKVQIYYKRITTVLLIH
jgi:hypothetical protein